MPGSRAPGIQRGEGGGSGGDTSTGVSLEPVIGSGTNHPPQAAQAAQCWTRGRGPSDKNESGPLSGGGRGLCGAQSGLGQILLVQSDYTKNKYILTYL